MGVTVDVTFKSLNKYSEILCGDTVECLKTEDSDVIILADGMGSGVKANILSTLTAKILGTMFFKWSHAGGMCGDDCADASVRRDRWHMRRSRFSRFSITARYI